MGWQESVRFGGRHIPLLNSTQGAITAAQTNTFPGLGGETGYLDIGGTNYLVVQAAFTYVASAATSADVYIQTSLDAGATWFDIVNAHFTTSTATKVFACTTGVAPASQGFAPGDAALSANTIIQGVIGDRLRAQLVTVGTYGTGTILTVDCWVKRS